MRTLAELIDEVRFNTVNGQDSRFDDARLIKFFNSAQRAIQKIIYNSNPSNSVFDKVQSYTITGNGPYDLPDDIYAVSAIKSVQPLSGNTRLRPLPYLDSREKNLNYGYYILKNQLFLAPTSINNTLDTFEITYTMALEDMTSTGDSPDLPSACEEYLMLFVERKINYVDSSSDLRNVTAFTDEERRDLEALFTNHHRDVKTPVIMDTTYMSY